MNRLSTDLQDHLRLFIDFKSTWVATSVCKDWQKVFSRPNSNEITPNDVYLLPDDPDILRKVLSTIRKYNSIYYFLYTDKITGRLRRLGSRLASVNVRILRSLRNVRHLSLADMGDLPLYALNRQNLTSLCLWFDNRKWFQKISPMFVGGYPQLRELTFNGDVLGRSVVESIIDNIDAFPALKLIRFHIDEETQEKIDEFIKTFCDRGIEANIELIENVW